MSRGRLFLIRHGESMGNVWKSAYRADERNFLSPMGITQAELCGKYFKHFEIDFTTLYSSNLLRARHTMVTILHEIGWHRPWINLPGLNEINATHDAAEMLRVKNAFQSIWETWTEGNLLVVSHYHTMQSIFDCMVELGVIADRECIDSHQGMTVNNGQPFVWNPEAPERLRLVDLYHRKDQF